jgi:hypothetical protein
MVQNGHFPIHTNDPVCIYFESELHFFEEDGSRCDRKLFSILDDDVSEDAKAKAKALDESSVKMDRLERTRKIFHDRENGNYPATPTNAKFDGKMHIARFVSIWTCPRYKPAREYVEADTHMICRIKPYMVSKHMNLEGTHLQHFPADKARIFGKAISNALPFEKVDIMICRQSL